MKCSVKVYMKNGAGHLVQGVYSANGKKVRYSDPVGEGETAREVQEAQMSKAQRELGLVD